MTVLEGAEDTLHPGYLQLEPIGLIFLLFFAVVLLVQIVGMLLHRVMTLGHIVATTDIWPSERFVLNSWLSVQCP